MKLSKKGQFKLEQYLYEYSAYVSGLRTNAPDSLKFDHRDFDDAVVLTVEEAKVLLSIVMDSVHDHCITQEDANVFNAFVKRVKQVEGKE